MSLPRKLKSMNLFNEGLSYLGEVATVTLPKLTRKMEEWRGAGMDGTLEIDMGAEAMKMEWTMGGPLRDVLRQYGITSVAGIFLRFAGAYQRDDTGGVDAIEVTVRGRHSEIDMGDAKQGEGGEFKVATSVAYYRLDWNGVTEIEIDVLNGVFIVGGVDRSSELLAIVA